MIHRHRPLGDRMQREAVPVDERFFDHWNHDPWSLNTGGNGTELGDGAVFDIALSRDPAQTYMYVCDGTNMKIHILKRETLEILTSFGDGGRQPGEFYAVHSIATDSKGNIFTTETYRGQRVQKFL